MGLMDNEERSSVAAVAALTDCNPFLPERIKIERRILGPAFVPTSTTWHADGDTGPFDPNLPHLRERIEQLAVALYTRLADGRTADPQEVTDYRGLIFYHLFLRYEDDWLALIDAKGGGLNGSAAVGCYDSFADDLERFFSVVPGPPPDPAQNTARDDTGGPRMHGCKGLSLCRCIGFAIDIQPKSGQPGRAETAPV